jgi:TonB family protein
MSRARSAAVITAFVLIAAQSAYAQERTNTLSGVVVDPMEWGIPDARVRVTDMKTKRTRNVRTDQSGRYEIDSLRDGLHALHIESKGLEAFEDELSIDGADVERVVKLNIGIAREHITITSTGGIDPSVPRQRHAVSPPAPPKCSAASIEQRRGGQIRMPWKTVNVAPIYPVEAWDVGRNGSAIVAGVITREGRFDRLRVVEATHAAFAREALAVLRYWEFSPMYLNCSPMEKQLEVRMDFARKR